MSIREITAGLFDSTIGQLGRFLDRRRKQKRLKEMLSNKRFPKGFRSFEQHRSSIGASEEETVELLLSIRARKSEVTDEWTLNR